LKDLAIWLGYEEDRAEASYCNQLEEDPRVLAEMARVLLAAEGGEDK